MNIVDSINRLKEEKQAIIIAHYYQPDEIQAIADFVGDSLEMSRVARDSDAKVIVFCGVDFMAGSAKLLSPQKTVLLPELAATCPMANMATPEEVLKLKAKYPNATVVTYINSTVAVKTVSDICCTSSNAVKVVNSVESDEIIFLPDKNLGSYVARFTDKKIILWDGHCCVHNNLTAARVLETKAKYPNAEFVVHPECLSSVVNIAAFCGSTSKIIEYIKNSNTKEFIIGTEEGIFYKLRQNNPDKIFHLAHKNMRCGNMKKITLQKLYDSLKDEKYKIEFDREIIEKASLPVKRMMEIK
ncbi:MAG: quinolinate synthase NadA [Clostridia bacterium]|nr:quinolinate synthase NadA [Clostridia bacterium]